MYLAVSNYQDRVACNAGYTCINIGIYSFMSSSRGETQRDGSSVIARLGLRM